MDRKCATTASQTALSDYFLKKKNIGEVAWELKEFKPHTMRIAPE
jgi:hypothetical protein